MKYEEWLDLFRLSAKDDKVISIIAKYGIENFKLTFLPTYSNAAVDFKENGFFIGFISEFNFNGGNVELPILSGIGFKISLGKKDKNWNIFENELPFGILKTNSKEELFDIMGEPAVLNNDFCSLIWFVNGLKLGIHFHPGWEKIKTIGLSIPEHF